MPVCRGVLLLVREEVVLEGFAKSQQPFETIAAVSLSFAGKPLIYLMKR